MNPQKNDIVEFRIESAAYEGSAVGRIAGLVVFVPYAVPGDLIRARITRRRRRHVEAVIEEILEPSGDRIAPPCFHFGTCGGCRLQNVDYQKQLEYKQRQVIDLLERIGGITAPRVQPTLPSPLTYHYRNKMEFSFGGKRWLTSEEIASGSGLDRSFALGLHIPGRFDRILDIQDCLLHAPFTSRLLSAVRVFAVEAGWEPYDSINHCGYLRNLVVRWGQQTSEFMVVLVTAEDRPERMARFSSFLAERFPQVTTFVNAVNSTRSPVALGETEEVHFGEGVIHERLGALTFEISPSAFFQPNTLQTERLLGVIREKGGFRSHDRVFDLFCGMGTIGLSLASCVSEVVGVESWEESIRLARLNARENGIRNCRFFHADAGAALENDFMAENGSPDVVVLDPPRAGLSADLVEELLRVAPPRIVYTSCNPGTLARDAKILQSRYRIEWVQPVDMFPQTYHIECVVVLERR